MDWGKYRILSAIVLGAVATPAWAQVGIKIPEPTDMALFALAVGGLILGRRSSKTPPQDNDDA